MEDEKVIEKIDNFLNKEGYGDQDKYFITKRMNEYYWEDISEVDDIEEDDGEEDLDGDLGDEYEPEADNNNDSEYDEIDTDKVSSSKKKSPMIKRPVVKTIEKKKQTVEEPMEDPEPINKEI